MGMIDFKILRFSDPDWNQKKKALSRTYLPSKEIEEKVKRVLEEVLRLGDKAVSQYTEQFDKQSIDPQSFRVTKKPSVPPKPVMDALHWAKKNITLFAKASKTKSWSIRNMEGARVGEIYSPFQRIGVYVPGGTAPLVSTALMTVCIAKAAGVKEIAVVSPPPINPILHFAIEYSGATELYQIGGIQAIGALAFGTESIRKVEKIFGPGNAYVVEAKRQVVGTVAIDLLPGPSEIAVLASSGSNPEFIAADLLAQAEHGPSSKILFVTPDDALLQSVIEAINQQLTSLQRKHILMEVLSHHAYFVQVASLNEGIELIEDFAPEHLSLQIPSPKKFLSRLKNCGAIYLGPYSAVAAGDFLAGPSHTLPTGGGAKSFSGLTLSQFYKRTSVVEYSKKALLKVAPYLESFANIESLDAHGASIKIRRGKK
ncbi:histidinol dehydrogenase [Methylacidiphilum kamchatkense Kam1]|uniref:Histidinol dehydrogenase n=2 Tax=Methylacidiphilum kamchatkense TaxID=431057 RepID=A0A0C1RVM5_9BACT|nr:histidinol dehydrogenase [Methylacidiphilum kamchatkense Kam1]QDQ43116.1 histidinol dehydrogenase [Methylacidiphilum kamchatkense Kam1]